MTTSLDQVLEHAIVLDRDARDFGFVYPDLESMLQQLQQEYHEVAADLHANAAPEKIQEELGDLMFTAIALCTFCGFDVRQTLLKNNLKFEARMKRLRELAAEQGLDTLQGQSTERMMSFWRQLKQEGL